MGKRFDLVRLSESVEEVIGFEHGKQMEWQSDMTEHKYDY